MEERDIFKEPLSRAEMKGLVQRSGASEMFNFRSPAFRKRGLDRGKLTEDDLIKLMLGLDKNDLQDLQVFPR